MRLTKKAVGSWLGSFPGRRVSLLHSGQGPGRVGWHQLSEPASGCIPYSSIVTAGQDLWLLEVILADLIHDFIFNSLFNF